MKLDLGEKVDLEGELGGRLRLSLDDNIRATLDHSLWVTIADNTRATLWLSIGSSLGAGPWTNLWTGLWDLLWDRDVGSLRDSPRSTE